MLTEDELLINRLASVVVELHYAAQMTKNKEYAFQVREIANEISSFVESLKKEVYGRIQDDNASI